MLWTRGAWVFAMADPAGCPVMRDSTRDAAGAVRPANQERYRRPWHKLGHATPDRVGKHRGTGGIWGRGLGAGPGGSRNVTAGYTTRGSPAAQHAAAVWQRSSRVSVVCSHARVLALRSL